MSQEHARHPDTERDHHPDAEHAAVVIVGAGPVGVVAATLLSQRGIDSVVLEHHTAPYPLPRAVHLDDEVYCILRELGVDDRFAAISRPMPGMRLVDGGHRTMAEFRRDAVTGPMGCPQASMFDQPDLEQLLLDNLAAHSRVVLRRGATVTSIESLPGSAVVRYADTTGEHCILADAVLGCDGANSVVRDAIGASMLDLRFRERWLVIDVRTSAPLLVWGGVHQICDPHRPATFMHVTGTRYRWEFRLADGEEAADLTAPEVLAGLLEPWFGPSLPADVEIIRHATYTFRAQVADRWRSGRVFLLGDAAHQTPPFIGQGLGAGLRDAHNLAWKLAGVLHGQLGENVLETYEAERRPHATRTVRAAVAVGWALTGGQDRAALLRKNVLAVLCRVPGFSRAVLSSASPALGHSALVTGNLVTGRLAHRQPGRVFPAVLAAASPSRGFTIVSNHTPKPAEARALRTLGVGHSVGRGRGGAALIRPDGAVAAVEYGRSAVTRLLALVQSVSTSTVAGAAGSVSAGPARLTSIRETHS
ncbi:bifunctional 3-(3-hydroxy-phenyl)propionate/3-hydroxycinnamic acid hydroxylase [Nakamurella sp. PAMC28650]|uniref:bifunctional 3-(3-hydroxy-phenyl)propionate/3-hydroxycinnamic acid hydroxylase n=1 Tax=Nakamurella sp. PAMC28650 TaxID=2762325 RepID=UPI00164DB387|nr:bifunctional 3-(3-hydroxy-phenyl)propionate/3-hydroxycinnamic acid hydroxylase [Nakamurella sp. PAMC28650]QNK79355.1 bifunctional 3-(3-hydroxy-phenyl)propionate/3-hydroxycinnamic acid hydroxylase [Nakamurella sp. PAMC28650]